MKSPSVVFLTLLFVLDVNAGGPGMMKHAAESKTINFDEIGANCFKNRDWDGAVKAFSTSLKQNPTDQLAYECRGDCYFIRGDMDRAIADFTKQINIAPTNSNVFLNRATAYRAKYILNKALDDLGVCLKLNPSNDEASKSRASILSSEGDFEKAIADWSNGLQISRDDPLALTSRGWDYFMTSQFQKACEDFQNAIRLSPTNALAYNNLAWLLATSPEATARNGKEAIKNATKACELTRWADWSAVDTLAASYAEAGDFDKAVQYENQAISQGIDTVALGEYELGKMKDSLSLYQQKRPNHDGQKR